MLGSKETRKPLARLHWAVASVQWEERGRGGSFLRGAGALVWSQLAYLVVLAVASVRFKGGTSNPTQCAKCQQFEWPLASSELVVPLLVPLHYFRATRMLCWRFRAETVSSKQGGLLHDGWQADQWDFFAKMWFRTEVQDLEGVFSKSPCTL